MIERKYRDINDVPRTLEQMVRLEPDWAASRIRVAEQLEAERDKLRAENERLRANWPKHHGCACKFDDDDNLVSTCQAHREIIAERDTFREALKHYARDYDHEAGCSVWDGGAIARTALRRKP